VTFRRNSRSFACGVNEIHGENEFFGRLLEVVLCDVVNFDKNARQSDAQGGDKKP